MAVQMTPCPCCGQPTEAVRLETLIAVVSPVFAEMVELLSKTPGQFVPTEKIASYVWRRNSDGGPLNANICLSNLLSYNRRKLKALGYRIEGRLGRYGGYRLCIEQVGTAP